MSDIPVGSVGHIESPIRFRRQRTDRRSESAKRPVVKPFDRPYDESLVLEPLDVVHEPPVAYDRPAALRADLRVPAVHGRRLLWTAGPHDPEDLAIALRLDPPALVRERRSPSAASEATPLQIQETLRPWGFLVHGEAALGHLTPPPGEKKPGSPRAGSWPSRGGGNRARSFDLSWAGRP